MHVCIVRLRTAYHMVADTGAEYFRIVLFSDREARGRGAIGQFVERANEGCAIMTVECSGLSVRVLAEFFDYLVMTLRECGERILIMR